MDKKSPQSTVKQGYHTQRGKPDVSGFNPEKMTKDQPQASTDDDSSLFQSFQDFRNICKTLSNQLNQEDPSTTIQEEASNQGSSSNNDEHQKEDQHYQQYQDTVAKLFGSHRISSEGGVKLFSPQSKNEPMEEAFKASNYFSEQQQDTSDNLKTDLTVIEEKSNASSKYSKQRGLGSNIAGKFKMKTSGIANKQNLTKKYQDFLQNKFIKKPADAKAMTERNTKRSQSPLSSKPQSERKQQSPFKPNNTGPIKSKGQYAEIEIKRKSSPINVKEKAQDKLQPYHKSKPRVQSPVKEEEAPKVEPEQPQQQQQQQQQQPSKKGLEFLNKINLQLQNLLDQEKSLSFDEIQQLGESIYSVLVSKVNDTISLNEISQIIYKLLQLTLRQVKKNQFHHESGNQIQSQLEYYVQQNKQLELESNQMQMKYENFEQLHQQQLLSLEQQKQELLEKLSNQIQDNKQLVISNETFMNQLREKFLKSFQQKLSEIEIVKNSEIEALKEAQSYEMDVFKETCEKLIKEQLTSLVNYQEQIKKVIHKANIKSIEDFLFHNLKPQQSSSSNNSELQIDIYLEAVIQVLKRREIEMFELQSNVQQQIERANHCELIKLDLEQKVIKVKQQVINSGEKLAIEISGLHASNMEQLNAVISKKIERYVSSVKSSLTSVNVAK